MATLNLGSFSSKIKNSSVLAYYKSGSKKGQFDVLTASGATGSAVQLGTFTIAGSNYSLALNQPAAATAVSSITDNTAKNWNISSTLATSISNIKLGSGNDTLSFTGTKGFNQKLTIDTGAGNDQIVLASAADALNITAGAGADMVSVKYAKNDLKVDLGAGKDSVTVGEVKGNLTITGSGSDANHVLVSSVGQNSIVNITMGAGADSVMFNSADGTQLTTAISGKIALGAGKDYVLVNGSLNAATVTSGAGDKQVSISGTVTSSSITLGAGSDSVKIDSVLSASTLNLGDGNDKVSVVGMDKATVYAGAGADGVSLGGTLSGLVDLGAGNDSIVIDAAASADDFSVAGGTGKDTIDLSATFTGNPTVTLTDFSVTEDVVYVGGSNSVSTLEADGTLKLNNATLKAAGTNGYYAVRLKDSTHTWIEGWGGENAAMLNASGATESVVLHGVADVVDTLVGGSKSDTLYVERENYAVGGKGNDSLIINSNASDSQEYVGLTADGGKDTVSGFTAGADGDVVYLYQDNLGSGKLTKDSTTNELIVKDGSASLTLQDQAVNGELTINVKDRSGAVKSVDYVDTTANVANTDDMADIYYAGNGSAAIDFSNMDETLVVDLNNRNINFNNRSLANSSSTTYYGKFASVTGGSDTTILMGSATEKNTLVAGTGDTSLWGGGAKADLLDGNTSSSDNVVTFYYQGGDGKDTIQNADWGNADNSDVLYLNNFSAVEVKNDGVNTTVKIGDSDKLTVAGFSDANTVVKFTTDGTNIQAAKIGQSGQSNAWTYDESVNTYIGGTKNTMTVGNDVDAAELWLNGTHGKNFDSVAVVDATSNAGSVGLAGSAANETLMGGTGDTSLWGGAGNDILQGSGAGTTTFYFGKGDGSDVITSSGSDDKVVLYNVALTDFAGVDTATSGQIKATLTDGSVLTIQNVSSSSVSKFQLADGSTWTYDASENKFQQA